MSGQKWAFLDVEGVLIPELWVRLAQVLALPDLALTTRDVPDYRQLVRQRLHSLAQRRVSLATLQQQLADVPLLDGAAAFVAALKERGYQVVLVSDAFEPLLRPFLAALAPHAVYAHDVLCDAQGLIIEVAYCRTEGKHETVAQVLARQAAPPGHTLAVGDAFNDFSMLLAVAQGFLLNASDPVQVQAPQGILQVSSHAAILAQLPV